MSVSLLLAYLMSIMDSIMSGKGLEYFFFRIKQRFSCLAVYFYYTITLLTCNLPLLFFYK